MAAVTPGAAPPVNVSPVQSVPPQDNQGSGLAKVAFFSGAITLLTYFQLVGTYNFLHKRHPRIFKKPKLPPFEVVRQRLLNSKLAHKLRKMGAEPEASGVTPEANREANFSGQDNEGYVDDDNQEPNLMDQDIPTRPASSRAATGPRFRTARQPNWAQRARRVNRQMGANNAA